MAVGAPARSSGHDARSGARVPPRPGERRTSTGRRLRAVPLAARSPRLGPFLLAATALVAGLVLAVATLQALVAQNSFRMEDLGRRATELRRLNGELRLEVARLSSPRRIANEARRLGLRLPDPAEVRTLEAGPSRAGTGSK